jgi:ABC-type Fe3+ transport system permease subunit
VGFTFLIPFLTPPYIAALSWMLVLQTNGYLQQITGINLNDVLFSKTGIVLVMALNIFRWSILRCRAACWRAGSVWRW